MPPSSGSIGGSTEPACGKARNVWSPCLCAYLDFSVPSSDQAATIPSSTLTATGPQTVSFSGTKHFQHDEGGGLITKVDYDWTMSITFKCH
ncbi:MAG: hypothetical protein ACXVEM_01715 [Gaiellaceae bacterium]